MKSQTLMIVAGLSIIGCGKGSSPGADPKQSLARAPEGAPVTPQNERTLFPFAEGNVWTYAIEIKTQIAGKPEQNATGEIQYKITSVVKNSPDSVRATLAIMQNGKQTDVQEWGCDSKGIFQLSMKSSKTPYSPKQPVIRFPVKDQDAFRWEGTGLTPIGKPGSMRYAFKNDGTLPADTEMGQMNAVFMESGGSFKTSDGIIGQIIVNSWFTPGVGLVRYKQEIGLKGGKSSITLRLKSYNVKK